MAPDMRYALTPDGVHIAYMTLGEGPALVLAPTLTWSIEWAFEDPDCSRFLDHLAEFARVIVFDKRGTGRSDPIVGAPTLEQRATDIAGVMDAAFVDQAVIMGLSEGGSMAAMFAATHPERTAALITYGAMVRTAALPDDVTDPFVMLQSYVEPWVESIATSWSGPGDLNLLTSEDDRAAKRSIMRRQQLSASPAMAVAIARLSAEIDIRPILPSIRVPTLVLHRKDEALISPDHARYIASHIEGAKYVELPGAEHFPWLQDSGSVVGEVQKFMTGVDPDTRHDRILSTVLFTDICGSTNHASTIGDARWRHIAEEHTKLVEHLIARHRGTFVRSTGDGAIGIFDGPSRAVRCAKAIVTAVEDLGVEARAGVHSGEIELIGEDIGGIAVHIAQRVMDHATRREVWTSRTVRDLAVGSGILFEDLGDFELKGVPEAWRLYRAKTRG